MIDGVKRPPPRARPLFLERIKVSIHAQSQLGNARGSNAPVQVFLQVRSTATCHLLSPICHIHPISELRTTRPASRQAAVGSASAGEAGGSPPPRRLSIISLS